MGEDELTDRSFNSGAIGEQPPLARKLGAHTDFIPTDLHS